MEYYLLHTLIVVTAITRHVTIVDSCTCPYQNPYQEICQSHVAVNATVLSTSFPFGVPDTEYELYPVRYQLDIHNVFNSPGGIDTVPDVVTSLLPGSVCGLHLANDTTYILAGNIADDPENPGKKVIAMGLCHLHMNVSRRWGPYQEHVDEIIERLDCSNPQDTFRPNVEMTPLKRNQQDNGRCDNGRIRWVVDHNGEWQRLNCSFYRIK